MISQDHILLVEDDNADAMLIERSIRKAQIANPVRRVADGEAAIAYLNGTGRFADREQHPAPRIVLLDLKLPRRTGFEILEWLRAQDGPICRLPVIVLTSSPEPRDINRAYELGANSYFVKPGHPDELLHLFEKLDECWLTLLQSAGYRDLTRSRMTDAQYSGPLRILIVDDTPADRLLAKRQIQQAVAGATITEIGGENQLEQALTRPDFDLVITDFQLQWTSGLAVLDRVRAVAPECPVIMFTDSGDEEIAVEAMRRGLDDYIPKNPKRSAPLSAAILRVMRRRHEQATIRALEQDRRRVNEALRLNEKFAELGRLAGVIAHEINNPLESLVNLLYLVREDHMLPQHLRSYIQTCEAELGRISTITRQTLTFYRESRAPELTEMGPLVDGILAMFAHKATSRVLVEREYEPADPVLAYPSQLRQVFVNLISNALDAMEGTSGRLVVRIRGSHGWNGSRVPGVRVSVGDTGRGIDAASRARLFQAFFTTKGESGTGLGLWVTHDIVERHRGTIHVYSNTRPQCHGTVFSVFFPLSPA